MTDQSREIILITGTPGTGKTTISSEIEGYEVIHVSELVQENNNSENEIVEVTEEQLIELLDKELSPGKSYIIEGHLSHLYTESDLCIVFRCNPKKLEKRLQKREYSEKKIKQNIESEKLDLILSEAVETHEKVYEIDTTEKNVQETINEVNKAIKNKENRVGVIDWSEYI